MKAADGERDLAFTHRSTEAGMKENTSREIWWSALCTILCSTSNDRPCLSVRAMAVCSS